MNCLKTIEFNNYNIILIDLDLLYDFEKLKSVPPITSYIPQFNEAHVEKSLATQG